MCVLLCNTREMGHVHTTHENPFHPFFFATSDLLCLYVVKRPAKMQTSADSGSKNHCLLRRSGVPGLPF